MNYSIEEYLKSSDINTKDEFITQKIIKLNAFEIKNKKEIRNFLLFNEENILRIKKFPFIFTTEKTYKTFKLINLKSTSIILKEPIHDSYILEIKLLDEYFSPNELFKILLPENIQIPTGYQIIGDILHVNLSEEQLKYKKIIGEIFLTLPIKIVVTKLNSINNEFRYLDLEVIASKSSEDQESSLKTVHIENGLKYFIDYSKVYWNSKLQEERRKILQEIKECSVLVDPFCGVGPIVLPSLKKKCKVFCNDLNPIAVECLKKNIYLNKLNNKNAEIFNLCAKEFLTNLPNLIENEELENIISVKQIDYIFFNLPELSMDFLKYLKHEIYANAVIFCFFFCKKNVSVLDFLKSKGILINANIEIQELRNVSPSKMMFILKGLVCDII